jgi:deoxyribodipyrimidine photo-lyase
MHRASISKSITLLSSTTISKHSNFFTHAKIMAPKRKSVAGAVALRHTDPAGSKPNARSAEAASKKQKTEASSSNTESFLNRKYYPAEMSAYRCAAYNDGTIPRPIEVLEDKIKTTKQDRDNIKTGQAILHWFKRDLRLEDNRGLAMAADLAKRAKVPLICLYIVSPDDLEAHLVSAARVDFDLRTLKVLQKDLDKLDIPLIMDTVEKRKDIPSHIVSLCQEHGISHVITNIEYEVDELRREAKLIDVCLAKSIAFLPVHDDVVVPPGTLASGQGKQYAVYTPWFRSWIKHIHSNPELLDPSQKPSKNPSSARESFSNLFNAQVPAVPEGKKLTSEQTTHLHALWPAGEHEAQARLQKFTTTKIKSYASTRNIPSAQSTSILSVHHSSGTLSARSSIRAARAANSTTNLDGGNEGIRSWISEVAWRDFYKHVLVNWPYVCMGKPFKYEYAAIEWEYDNEAFKAWCEGRTGFPIVDAAMRQLRETAYMHNRCRMVVASFLAKDLLLDWRKGEAFFHSHLIDCDFASNNGGWGFSASVGVDPQPYFRVFNPRLQSEKFDPDGEYIRKWVPELRDVKGKAIHDPYGSGAANIAAKNGYPRAIVDHAKCRERALARYKAGIGRTTA